MPTLHRCFGPEAPRRTVPAVSNVAQQSRSASDPGQDDWAPPCPACGRRFGVASRTRVIPIHGPVDDRCEGSRANAARSA